MGFATPNTYEPPVTTCTECGCRTGGGAYCYQHRPYTVWPLKDGSFRCDRNGMTHIWLEEPPSRESERIQEEPVADQYILITKRAIHIPGDERSRTAPGHGYPESTEVVSEVKAFKTFEEFEHAVSRAYPPSLTNAVGYKVSETYTFTPTHAINVVKVP